jgi:predicted negative regulator of RcsB-dependent stress response
MVEIYLSDEEQEEALRNWWSENWRWIFAGVALGLALLAGWKYWQQSKLRNAEAASIMYVELQQAASANDAGKAEQVTRDLQQKYASSPYAQQANLVVAKLRVQAGKWDEAAAALRDVMDHSKDEALAQVARLRLARVLIEQGHNDEALTLLDPSKAPASVGELRELRGDALLAKNDIAGARSEYQQALVAQAGEGGSGSELLQLKLQDLGPATTPAAAPAPAAEAKKTP